MSKAVSSKPAKAGNRWLNIISRILVALLLLLAVLGFLISVAGIVRGVGTPVHTRAVLSST